ncbi:hypothetical protein T484DRAFT_1976931 [Baffinella frigidus]|nr:hypothetical protein T484DRAFT_1976931 [Cryptophyta sp. CCMP2293]
MKCAACGSAGTELKKCLRCNEVSYCNKDCQTQDWKSHKKSCGAVRELFEMGAPDARDAERKAQCMATKKAIRAAKKSGAPVFSMSSTAFGFVAPGMPIPAGVPPNYGLKQAAILEIHSGSSSAGGRGNMRGEQAYRAYYDDLEANREQWLAFFDMHQHYGDAEQTCGILGTLATIYRQRGVLDMCEKVLDMEDEVLRRYQRSSAVEGPGAVRCYDELNYKYQVIRYNIHLQKKRYSLCGTLFRNLARYEIKYKKNRDDQNYLFMLTLVLNKRQTAAVLDSLTDAEVEKIVLAPLALPGSENLHVTDQARRNVALQTCACCGKMEQAIATFFKCSKCMCTYYCGAECQKQDWKAHKKLCPQLAA